MDLRIFTEPQMGASYDDQLRVAQAAEAAGYDAFFRSDHFLVMGDASGEPGPTDSWVTLGALARETSRIRLGTLVTSATFRLPGPLAITVAQVDAMSRGRVELGLGSGWFAAEHEAYGIPFPGLGERFDRLTEQLEIITGLWGTLPGERFSYRGRALHDRGFARAAQAGAAAAPAGDRRRPGREADARARRPVRRARSTCPSPSRTTVAAQFARVDAACRAIGRDPAELVRSVAQTIAVGRDDAEVRQRALTIGRDPADMKRRTGWPAPWPRWSTGSGSGGRRPVSRASTCSCWTWPTSTRST